MPGLARELDAEGGGLMLLSMDYDSGEHGFGRVEVRGSCVEFYAVEGTNQPTITVLLGYYELCELIEQATASKRKWDKSIKK